jgi:hypothetical protein
MLSAIKQIVINKDILISQRCTFSAAESEYSKRRQKVPLFGLKYPLNGFSEKITLRKSIKVTQNGSPFGMEKWVPLIEAGEVFGTLSPFAWMICKRILKKNKL